MNKSKVIAGIEIGSSKVATVVAQVSIEEGSYEQKVNIVGVSSVPSKGIKKGQIVNIEEAVESTITSIEAAERKSSLLILRELVSMPLDIFSTIVKLRKSTYFISSEIKSKSSATR